MQSPKGQLPLILITADEEYTANMRAQIYIISYAQVSTQFPA
jgi:hypothetical protein